MKFMTTAKTSAIIKPDRPPRACPIAIIKAVNPASKMKVFSVFPIQNLLRFLRANDIKISALIQEIPSHIKVCSERPKQFLDYTCFWRRISRIIRGGEQASYYNWSKFALLGGCEGPTAAWPDCASTDQLHLLRHSRAHLIVAPNCSSRYPVRLRGRIRTYNYFNGFVSLKEIFPAPARQLTSPAQVEEMNNN